MTGPAGSARVLVSFEGGLSRPRHDRVISDHEALLALAHGVYSATSEGDRDRLEWATYSLFRMLGSHLRGEAGVLVRLPPQEARLLERGQRRLLSVLDEFVAEAIVGCTQPVGRYRDQAEEILAFCLLQVHDERTALRDRAS